MAGATFRHEHRHYWCLLCPQGVAEMAGQDCSKDPAGARWGASGPAGR